MTPEDIAQIDFDKGGGLVPVVVQDDATLQVLMLGYMDRAAVAETLVSGEATFFSRSRGGRWRKGETSGNRLKLASLMLDCDSDTLLARVTPVGPTCHLGTTSCFGTEDAPGIGRLGRLEHTIAQRAKAPVSESGTARLLQEGLVRVAQKVGEEGVEAALAGATGSEAELCGEVADVFYHVLVLLHARGIKLERVMDVLAARAKR